MTTLESNSLRAREFLTLIDGLHEEEGGDQSQETRRRIDVAAREANYFHDLADRRAVVCDRTLSQCVEQRSAILARRADLERDHERLRSDLAGKEARRELAQTSLNESRRELADACRERDEKEKEAREGAAAFQKYSWTLIDIGGDESFSASAYNSMDISVQRAKETAEEKQQSVILHESQLGDADRNLQAARNEIDLLTAEKTRCDEELRVVETSQKLIAHALVASSSALDLVRDLGALLGRIRSDDDAEGALVMIKLRLEALIELDEGGTSSTIRVRDAIVLVASMVDHQIADDDADGLGVTAIRGAADSIRQAAVDAAPELLSAPS